MVLKGQKADGRKQELHTHSVMPTKAAFYVMPANAGIHVPQSSIGPRFRGDDLDWCALPVPCFLLPAPLFD